MQTRKAWVKHISAKRSPSYQEQTTSRTPKTGFFQEEICKNFQATWQEPIRASRKHAESMKGKESSKSTSQSCCDGWIINYKHIYSMVVWMQPIPLELYLQDEDQPFCATLTSKNACLADTQINAISTFWQALP